MRVNIPIRARTAIPNDYASIEVGASVEVEVPDTLPKEKLKEVYEYVLQLELHLGESALPYAMELLKYVQNKTGSAQLSPDQLRILEGNSRRSEPSSGGTPEGG